MEYEFIFAIIFPSDYPSTDKFSKWQINRWNWMREKARWWYSTQHPNGLTFKDNAVAVYDSTQNRAWFNAGIFSRLRSEYESLSGSLIPSTERVILCLGGPLDKLAVYSQGGGTSNDNLACYISPERFHEINGFSALGNQRYAMKTVCHELGHTLGFGHDAGDNIMSVNPPQGTLHLDNGVSFNASRQSSLDGNNFTNYRMGPKLNQVQTLNGASALIV